MVTSSVGRQVDSNGHVVNIAILRQSSTRVGCQSRLGVNFVGMVASWMISSGRSSVRAQRWNLHGFQLMLTARGTGSASYVRVSVGVGLLMLSLGAMRSAR